MKNKFNALANLYDLIQSAEKELGLKGLTEKDKLVLKQIIDNIDENNNIKLTYKQTKEMLSKNGTNISRAQFFKSLSSLVEKRVISKIGLTRSSIFSLNLRIIN